MTRFHHPDCRLLVATLLLTAAVGATPADTAADTAVATAAAARADVDATGSEDERAAVIAAVEAFFEAMRTRDVAAWRELLTADGASYRLTPAPDGGWVATRRGNDDTIAGLAAASQRWDERMFDPTVLVHGPMAVVWAPYVFEVDGEFSHCGVDSFSLLELDGRWRLGDAMWTVEHEGCEALLPE